ncbi:hypothetical protein [Dactylosporangium sp. NPDC051541]|uniref:hypothetical protein n=1 Tax=Dactylosporangium sp. NPDC051541 TaxID=3363977 RepID=UPI0037BC8E0D
MDELLRAIRHRVDRFLVTHEPGLLLSREAVAEANALWSATFGGAGEGTVEVAHALGMFAMGRAAVLPDGQDQDDARQAVKLFRMIASHAPELVPEQMRQYIPLGARDVRERYERAAELLRQFEERRDVALLDEAAAVLRSAVDIPADDGARASVLNALGVMLSNRFEHTGDAGSLDEAVTRGREAVVADGGSPLYQSNLGVSLRNRYHHRRDPADLDEAVRCGEAAVRGTGRPQDPAMYRAMLGLTYRARAEHTGDLSDLDRAVDLMRAAVAGSAVDDPDLGKRTTNLTSVLTSRYDLRGNAADLDEAVAVADTWVQRTPVSGPDRAAALGLLASCLEDRHDRTGNRVDIEHGIRAARDAVRASADMDRAEHLSRLERLLRSRFRRYGALADIIAAIETGRQAIALLPTNSPDRAWMNSHLCSALRSLFFVNGRVEDLRASIDAGRAAVAVRSLRSVHDLGHATNLAGALADMAYHTGEPHYADEAIQIMRDTIERTPATDRYRPSRLSNLSNLLQRTRAPHSRSAADEAVRLARDAVGLTDPAAPGLEFHQLALADALLARHAHSASPADLDEAVAAYQHAAGQQSGAPDWRIAAAREWASLAARRGQWAKAVDGYVSAADLLDVAIWPGLDREDRERKLLNVARDLGTGGAASALNAGRAGTAVSLVEAGRAVIWAQLLNSRTDLTRLSAANPQLAVRLDAVRRSMATRSDD